MKLALIVSGYRPQLGGIETHVEHLARYAATRGHEVEVLSQTNDHAQPRAEVIDGVSVRRFRISVPSTNYAVSPSLWRFLKHSGGEYDIAHAHNYHALPALAAALNKRAPLVFTPHYHGTSASVFRRLLHVPYRVAGAYVVRRADAVICVSEHEALLLTRDFPFAADRIEVIPNGVDVTALRAAKPFREDRTVVLSAGRLEDYKRVDRVVAAIALLDDRFILRITGDGPMRSALERQINELGVSHRVAVLGRVQDADLRRWFKTASVYVTASQLEASGITPLEVLASGTRVVASGIDAHRDLALGTGGPVALVSDDPSPVELADAIRTAGDMPAACVNIASWEEVGDRTLAVYEGVSDRRVGLVSPPSGSHAD